MEKNGSFISCSPTALDLVRLIQKPAKKSNASKSTLGIAVSYQTIILELTSDILLKSKYDDFKNFLETIRTLLTEDGYFVCIVGTLFKNYLKVLFDTIFGKSLFVNEIIIRAPILPTNSSTKTKHVNKHNQSILVYAKSENHQINPMYKSKQRQPYWHTMHSKGQGDPKHFRIDNISHFISPPVGRHWTFNQATIDHMCNEGKIRLNRNGKPMYLIEGSQYIVDNNWLDVEGYQFQGNQVILSNQVIHRIIGTFSMKEEEFSNGGVLIIQPSKARYKDFISNFGGGIAQYFYNSNIQNKTIIQRPTIDFFSKLIRDLISSLAKPETKSSGPSSIVPLEIFQGKLTEKNTGWSNQMILGDNLEVLKSLLPNFRNKIQLIYIDPPFFTGKNEMIDIPIGKTGKQSESVKVIQKVAYYNKIIEGDPIKTFVHWFNSRLQLMHQLLSEDGILIVRFDHNFGHYAKIILDTIFGVTNFIGEFFIRRMTKAVSDRNLQKQQRLIHQFDSLFVYQKSQAVVFSIDINKNKRKNQDKIELEKNNNIWLDIVGYEKAKQTLYPTENSKLLLQRIITLFSRPQDIIADFFCGSGTTLSVAEKMNRRWIGVDNSEFSINEIRKRILAIENHQQFTISKINRFTTSSTNKNNCENPPRASVQISITEPLKVEVSIASITVSEIEKNEIDDLDLIDYWGIDWDYQPETGFIVKSHSFRKLGRGRKITEPVSRQLYFAYSQFGNYTIRIMICDILGNSFTEDYEINI